MIWYLKQGTMLYGNYFLLKDLWIKNDLITIDSSIIQEELLITSSNAFLSFCLFDSVMVSNPAYPESVDSNSRI